MFRKVAYAMIVFMAGAVGGAALVRAQESTAGTASVYLSCPSHKERCPYCGEDYDVPDDSKFALAFNKHPIFSVSRADGREFRTCVNEVARAASELCHGEWVEAKAP